VFKKGYDFGNKGSEKPYLMTGWNDADEKISEQPVHEVVVRF
jgi:hypothetical protein